MCCTEPALTQGLLERLFGGLQPPPSYEAPPPQPSAPSGPISTPRPSVASTAGPRRTTSYCVRLCDGRFFPVQATRDATPAQLCTAFCPLSPTKVFFGSDIKTAIAADGSHYAGLPHAFLYRDRFVANCSCDGKDSVGLAHIDLHADTALRGGDLVATPDGLAVFKGWNPGQGERQTPTFTPVPRSSAPVLPPPVNADAVNR